MGRCDVAPALAGETSQMQRHRGEGVTAGRSLARGVADTRRAATTSMTITHAMPRVTSRRCPHACAHRLAHTRVRARARTHAQTHTHGAPAPRGRALMHGAGCAGQVVAGRAAGI